MRKTPVLTVTPPITVVNFMKAQLMHLKSSQRRQCDNGTRGRAGHIPPLPLPGAVGWRNVECDWLSRYLAINSQPPAVAEHAFRFDQTRNGRSLVGRLLTVTPWSPSHFVLIQLPATVPPDGNPFVGRRIMKSAKRPLPPSSSHPRTKTHPHRPEMQGSATSES